MNIARFLSFAALFSLKLGWGANDRVCDMRVDRRKALQIDFGDERFYFRSHHCSHAFEVNPHQYLDRHGLTGPEAGAAGLPVHR